MNWTEIKPHGITGMIIECETPLGLARIEWKSWKENPDYSISIDDIYRGTEYDLERAKSWAKEYLTMKYRELLELLEEKKEDEASSFNLMQKNDEKWDTFFSDNDCLESIKETLKLYKFPNIIE